MDYKKMYEDLQKKHEELKENTQDVRMVLDDHRDTMILNQQLKSKITEMRGDQDELEEELEQWKNCTSYDDPDDVENEMDRLSELESCIHRVLWKSDTVDDDTDLLKLQSCIEEMKQENETMKKENTSLKKALEYTKKNKVNEDEIEKLKKKHEELKEETDRIKYYVKTCEPVAIREYCETVWGYLETDEEEKEEDEDVGGIDIDTVLKIFQNVGGLDTDEL